MNNVSMSITPMPSYIPPSQSPPAFMPASKPNSNTVTFSAQFETEQYAIEFAKFILNDMLAYRNGER